MKIAITADLHLTGKDNHPERYNALKNILDQMQGDHVEHLIIAGDLFDTSQKDFSEFEKLCALKRYKSIQIHIIPGNHDADLSDKSIAAENVHVYQKPNFLDLDEGGTSFFMLPYSDGKTMGEILESKAETLKTKQWILIGHGDWSEGLRAPNPYEPGIYMPLTTSDVYRYQPLRVFLGHIHVPMDKDRVHYVGSPCGLDITESGKRRYVIYDTVLDEVEPRLVDTDVLFFDETFVMLPGEDEKTFIKNACSERIKSWELSKEEREKVQVRIKVRGFCSDRKGLMSWIKTSFRYYASYKDEDPDISEVLISSGEDLRYIAEQVKDRVEHLEWREGYDEPDEGEILLAALHVIYGE
ncbi:MAG: hypothetical protein GTO18_15205 [Anaerolineales bacterium]|nr:hypothetical protein [Anaerolineales bacterium]